MNIFSDKVLVGCDEDRLWLKVVNKAWTELHLCTAVHLLLEQLAAKTGGRILLPISLLLPASKLHLTDPRMGSGALEGTLATGDLTPAGWPNTLLDWKPLLWSSQGWWKVAFP